MRIQRSQAMAPEVVQVEERKKRGRKPVTPEAKQAAKVARKAERDAKQQESGATPAPKERKAKVSKKREPSKGHVVEDRRVRIEDLTDEQHLCLVLQHAGKLRRQDTRVKAEKDELKKLRDLARGELGKTALHEIKLLGSLESEAGAEAMRENVEMQKRLARWGGVQIDIFDGSDDRTPSVDKAYHAGKVAGMAGSDCKAPEGFGMAQEQTWLKGWHDGQAVNRDLLLHMSTPAAPTNSDAFDAHSQEEPTAESVFGEPTNDPYRMGYDARSEGKGGVIPEDMKGDDGKRWLDGWSARADQIDAGHRQASATAH